MQAGLVDDPAGGGVDEGDVGAAAFGEEAVGAKAIGLVGGVEPAEAGGLGGEEGDEAWPGDGAGVDEGFGVEGEGGFEAHEAEGRVFEGELFFVGAVGGVVGGEEGNGAVCDALAEGLHVGLFAEGGVYLGEGVVAIAGVVGEEEVVGEASALTGWPSFRARRTRSTESAEEMC